MSERSTQVWLRHMYVQFGTFVSLGVFLIFVYFGCVAVSITQMSFSLFNPFYLKFSRPAIARFHHEESIRGVIIDLLQRRGGFFFFLKDQPGKDDEDIYQSALSLN